MNPTQVEQKFSDFHEKWIRKLEELFQQLLLAVNVHKRIQSEHVLPPENNNYTALVNKLTTHHKEYYTIKWAAAHVNVVAFFAPVWITPLENSYMWITGWKPSMFLKLLDSLIMQNQHQICTSRGSLVDLSEEQLKNIESLRLKIKNEEGRVEREVERQQVAIADPNMVELAKLVSRTCMNTINIDESGCTMSKVGGLVEVAMKNVMSGLEKVMKMADCVRLKTLKGVLDILSPEQSVHFLAATSLIQIQMRKWGKQRDVNGGEVEVSLENTTTLFN
ncbi:hypothetical protein LIER_41653 [Lithospermum erythrorhizon]|uniref:DOG1 domain-containing protein n=1 Tax=Lithospermum erythrorhizon TaxID=34254 RepID=A0AAV3RFX6_LITER